jgi:predicted Zn-dependent protease
MKPILLLLTAFFVACATSPQGRNQLILLDDSKMSQLGIEAFDQMKAQQPIEKDPAINAYVKCVAQPILKESGSDRSDWEIVVFKDDSANAFALPGGKVGVHTGMLKTAKTADQLAAVIGHEVGHVIARHGNERVSETMATQGIMTLTGIFTKDNPQQQLIMGALGVGTQFGVLLPHSRTQESEADIIGLEIMAKAGFNPLEAVELWKNMAAQGGQPPEFLSTHPAPANRIKNLQAHMGEAQVFANQAQTAGRHPNCRKP